MKVYNSIFLLLIGAACYMVSTMAGGCAQIGMPMGGPRDSIPPVLLKATPPDKTTHFEGNKITFTFDEYVHLDDIQKNLLVSPEPKLVPNVTSKLKTVSIKIRDTLQPNTTYSFQFGNAIQDINENNPIRDFTYVFSTGSYIDSLTLSGNVILAETGKTDSTLLALLYSDLSDSAVYKEKPRYIARLDSSGNFRFRFLAPGSYHLFALKDETGQKKYNNPSQLFAFADSVIHPGHEVKPLTLYAYAEEKYTKPPAAPAQKKNPKKLLTYSSSLSNNIQDLLTPLTLQFAVPLKTFDSSKIKLTDTLFHPIAPAQISIDTTFKQITIRNSWVENTEYKLILNKNFAVDTLGDTLQKSDTLLFKTKQEHDYGSIKLTFENLSKIAHPVLQFVQNNVVVDSFKLTSPNFSVPLFNPGEYELRILDDENENGTWDPGDYHLKKQPERVEAILKKLSIRANWDNEATISL